MQIGNKIFKPGLIPTIVFLLVLPVLLRLGFWQLQVDLCRGHRNADPHRHRDAGGVAVDIGLSAIASGCGPGHPQRAEEADPGRRRRHLGGVD